MFTTIWYIIYLFIYLELGLSSENMKELIENTNIIFHMAATLKLEANLKDAIQFNTLGTKRVLEIAKKMLKLEIMLHLSTAFCCCDQVSRFYIVFQEYNTILV